MKPRRWGEQPLSVYKASEQRWEWHCRTPLCHASDWTVTQEGALKGGLRHLCRHNFIGIGGSSHVCT